MSRPCNEELLICAASGCDSPVPRGGRGRPRIYCSIECRPGVVRQGVSRLVVEVAHEPIPDQTRPTGRIWMVRLRRSTNTVVIASELGRPSADHLASQIDGLINPRRRTNRAAMD